jgi:hypothetical protein
LQGEISQVVVDKVVVDESSGTESIVDFVTPFADSDLSKSSKTDQVLRKEMVDRLQNTVPLWMIPKNVISISAMPKTATGKLDRRSLKNCVPESVDLKSSRAAGAESDTITRSSTNKVKQSKAAKSNFTFLMPIWCRILRIDTEIIDGGSSWSEAGGDSLTAMMFVREARKAGYQLSSDKLMSDMSLIELCNMFRRRDDTVSQSIATPDDRTPGCDSHVPLTDFQHFYLSRLQYLGKDQLYKYDITFRGEFDLAILQAALCQWVQDIEALRLTFSSSGQELLEQSLIRVHSRDWEPRLCRHQDDGQLTVMSAKHDFSEHPVLVSLSQPNGSENVTIRLAIHIHHAIFDSLPRWQTSDTTFIPTVSSETPYATITRLHWIMARPSS